MTGYQSKKKSRHADEITLDHLIKLRTENERLREALEKIIIQNNFGYWGRNNVEKIARAALKEKE